MRRLLSCGSSLLMGPIRIGLVAATLALLPLSGPAQAEKGSQITVHLSDDQPVSYALIRPQIPLIFVGNHDELKAAKRYSRQQKEEGLKEASLWIRADGRDYLLTDQEKLTALSTLWQAMVPVKQEMDVLQDKMALHEDEMQAIEDLAEDVRDHDDRVDHVKMAELQQRTKLLHEQIEPITERMETLSEEIESLSEKANSQAMAVIEAALKDGTAKPLLSQ